MVNRGKVVSARKERPGWSFAQRDVAVYELASKIYAWSVFVSLLSVPYRFPWFWILQVCKHRGIVFCQSPIVFQGKTRKQHRDETSLTKVVDDNFEVASYAYPSLASQHYNPLAFPPLIYNLRPHVNVTCIAVIEQTASMSPT